MLDMYKLAILGTSLSHVLVKLTSKVRACRKVRLARLCGHGSFVSETLQTEVVVDAEIMMDGLGSFH